MPTDPHRIKLPQSLFDPGSVDPVVQRQAKALTEITNTAPHWTQTGAPEARKARIEGRSALPAPVYADQAEWRECAGPAGPVRLRYIPHDNARGTYLHIHGGGWVLGGADHQDLALVALSRATGLACLSVEYRLAPEHPFPAGPDDCLAAARHLIDQAGLYGGDQLYIGGESAGAHLAAVTLLRLRDKDGISPFLAANLVYGAYDLRMTPGARAYGQDKPILRTSDIENFVAAFAGDTDPADPAISPVLADLSGLCPALFSVGTNDALYEDTMAMWARWSASGNPAELALYTGGYHAFNAAPSPLTDAFNARVYKYLNEITD